MAKSNNNEIKARSKWTLGDIVVHIILVILSVIWVLPIAWIIMISFRGEKGQYVSTLLPKSLTLANYKAFYRHRYSEFHADVQEYFDNSNFLMYNINSVRACSFILYVKNAFQTEKAIYECGTYPWNVPGIHGYDSCVLHP